MPLHFFLLRVCTGYLFPKAQTHQNCPWFGVWNVALFENLVMYIRCIFENIDVYWIILWWFKKIHVHHKMYDKKNVLHAKSWFEIFLFWKDFRFIKCWIAIVEESDVCDWLRQPTPCLYLDSEQRDWYSANYKCNQLHGYLVDRDAILHHNLNLSNVYYWTGLTRTRQIWTDGES